MPIPSGKPGNTWSTAFQRRWRGDLKGDDVELLGEASGQEQLRKQLLYVGRRSISKYGCSGCHDIPGYEDMKPIGTGLADWGRKAADKLAFEQITQYILQGHGHDTPKPESQMDEADQAYVGPHSEQAISDEVELAHSEGRHELNFENMPPSDRLFHGKAVRPRARRLRLAEAPRAAQLRLQEDREQGLQRAAADAAVQPRRTSSASK